MMFNVFFVIFVLQYWAFTLDLCHFSLCSFHFSLNLILKSDANIDIFL